MPYGTCVLHFGVENLRSWPDTHMVSRVCCGSLSLFLKICVTGCMITKLVATLEVATLNRFCFCFVYVCGGVCLFVCLFFALKVTSPI